MALASVLTYGRASRPSMTGEITLRGRVLPIGGVKEKLLAAHRAGIYNVLLPADNTRDLQEMPENILRKMNIEFVEHMDEVMEKALLDKPDEDDADLAFIPGADNGSSDQAWVGEPQ